MLKLPPPIWALICLLVAGVVSWLYPWRALADLKVLWLGALLIALGFGLAFSAAMLFRRKGTEITPTSEANKLLVIEGPFRVTRNPMYLGLVIFALGIAVCAGSLPIFTVPLVVFAIANWAHFPFEEAKMRR